MLQKRTICVAMYWTQIPKRILSHMFDWKKHFLFWVVVFIAFVTLYSCVVRQPQA